MMENLIRFIQQPLMICPNRIQLQRLDSLASFIILFFKFTYQLIGIIEIQRSLISILLPKSLHFG